VGVLGNLAFQSGAFYVVQVNPTTASTTNVFGPAPASLAGTVVANFAPGSYVSRSYTILTAVGGVTGTFSALRTLGLPTNFAAGLSYTGNTALLNIRAQLVPEAGLPGQPGQPLRLANGVTLLAKFHGEFASHSSTYGGTGTFRYRW